MMFVGAVALTLLAVVYAQDISEEKVEAAAELWPANQANLKLGQISGVDVDKYGNIHIFHRGDHVWGTGAFDASGSYLQKSNGPIQIFTLLTFDPRYGEVLQRRGANRYYMPHGITIDNDDNVWITDVALHQVFKLGPQGDEPLMTLGKAFSQGSDQSRFCQPTDVAVTNNGEFFVADGYCNSRIVKFSPKGQFLMQFGEQTTSWPPAPGQLRIPHGLALIEDGKAVCVADRENQRFQCFSTQNGQVEDKYRQESLGRVFALASVGSNLFGISQPGLLGGNPAMFVADLSTGRIESMNPGVVNPHDLAISKSGNKERYAYVAEIGPNRLIRIPIEEST